MCLRIQKPPTTTPMKILRSCLPLLAVLLLLQGQAFAQSNFYAILTQSQEPPPAGTTPPTTSTGGPRPTAYGFAYLTLNPAMTALSMVIQIFNIDVTGLQTPNDTNDNLQAAHIHAPAPPGSNAGVRWGFFGLPFNDTTPTDTMVTPFIGGVGGTFTTKWDDPEGNGTTLSAQLGNLFAGLAYLNFHTVQFGGGEIRGQILPAPEGGSTMALLGFTAVGLAFIRARVRRNRT